MAVMDDFARKNSPYFSAFAVGVLLTVTLLHLLPEGYEMTPRIWQWVSLGFFFFLVLGLLLRLLTSGQSLNTDLSFAYSSTFALASHSVLDGILYATAFQGSEATGWLSVIGLLVHEVPEGVIIYYMLLEARMSNTMALLVSFFAACVSTLLGTILALFAVKMFDETSIAAMMGITAGAFLYILMFHLGPHAATAPDRRGYLAAGFGVALMTMALILTHGFHHAHHH